MSCFKFSTLTLLMRTCLGLCTSIPILYRIDSGIGSHTLPLVKWTSMIDLPATLKVTDLGAAFLFPPLIWINTCQFPQKWTPWLLFSSVFLALPTECYVPRVPFNNWMNKQMMSNIMKHQPCCKTTTTKENTCIIMFSVKVTHWKEQTILLQKMSFKLVKPIYWMPKMYRFVFLVYFLKK